MKMLSIRGSSRADLLAIPPVVFGYHPRDSLVVLALHGGVLQMSARLSLDWHLTHYEATVAQMSAAIENVPGCRFVLAGYGERERAMASVLELADVVGHCLVIDAVVTDGELSWGLGDDVAEPYRFEDTAVAAQAVFAGVTIARSREEAVAPVTEHRPASRRRVEKVEQEVAQLPRGKALRRFARLIEREEPLSPSQALRLAVHLGDDDAMVSALAALGARNADRVWHNVVAARRVCPPRYEANVLAILAAASWLSGRGAAQTACLEQLGEIDPVHVVGGYMAQVHREGRPPGSWEG
jgi:hypothetical protein